MRKFPFPAIHDHNFCTRSISMIVKSKGFEIVDYVKLISRTLALVDTVDGH